MPRKSPKNVVVITGAWSTLGQALALEFAMRGDALVLAAPGEELLEAPKRACETMGSWTLGVVVPEGSEEAMHGMAALAVERFGRIDIWVNHAVPSERPGAGDSEAASLQSSSELSAFTIGARAAISAFRTQKHGLLINLDASSGGSHTSSIDREAVRQLFETIAEQARTVEGVRAQGVLSTPGTSSTAVARRVVELARSTARGDVWGRATALLAGQRLRRGVGGRKVRRASSREAAGTHMGLSFGSSGYAEGGAGRRRGGWHLAHADESHRAMAVVVIVALPLAIAAVMLALVQ